MPNLGRPQEDANLQNSPWQRVQNVKDYTLAICCIQGHCSPEDVADPLSGVNSSLQQRSGGVTGFTPSGSRGFIYQGFASPSTNNACPLLLPRVSCIILQGPNPHSVLQPWAKTTLPACFSVHSLSGETLVLQGLSTAGRAPHPPVMTTAASLTLQTRKMQLRHTEEGQLCFSKGPF